ncbi:MULTISPECIES: glucosaminidase domain-containing protein [unclassified Lebetimonas]|uniref:glucosaminidase domain-containing protein n=1 Tax=unclassified Lebetimonas TaxID=2648158 RepID=UPI0004648888|nr:MULTISPECIES: glucosaminidase domain-containing protein [unclassified Lebetimonas]
MKKIISLLIFNFSLFTVLNAAFPDWYYNIRNINEQKKAFVEIMLPLIQTENKNILNLRKKIIKIFNDPAFLLKPEKIAFLAKKAKKYKIKNILNRDEFLKKIDTIPPSLALAQAAIESGWGKSRFVKLANNLFGHWEYSNNGLSPKDRYSSIDINYSLKIFPSIEDSIKAYMLNLNRNPAYKEFRNVRYFYKLKNKKFTGLIAATTMELYSQKRDEYVKLLQKMIIQNHWEKFDK